PFKVLTPQAAPTTGALGRIAELVAAGDIRPVIDRAFPLEEAPAAIRYLEAEHAQAKVVIMVRGMPAS
ncbi:MAG: zinc-binding dehydrogenase, partial [Nocardioides sp.]